jgi:hypothetical protein
MLTPYDDPIARSFKNNENAAAIQTAIENRRLADGEPVYQAIRSTNMPGRFERYAAAEPSESQRQQQEEERAAAAESRFQRDRTSDSQTDCNCRFTGGVADASDCEAHSGRPRSAQHPAPITNTPPRRIACPKCHAGAGARCVDKSGAYMRRYHAERTEAARPPEVLAISTAAPHTITTAQAVAEIETAAHAPEPSLGAAVEALVARYTCGAVIDAAWAAGAKLHPWKGRTA